MFNQFIKKPKEEPKKEIPKVIPIAEPIKVPVVPVLKPKKEKLMAEGLNEIENKVLRFIQKNCNPFPVTINTISNWCDIPEKQAEIISEKLVLDSQYKIRKVKHHIREFALESF